MAKPQYIRTNMAQLIVSTSKKVWNDLIPVLDQKKFFLLNNANCTRRKLFNFALALGLNEGFTMELEGKNDLFRTERIENDRHLYSAVYFNEELDCNSDRIEEILHDEKVYPCVEQYAETGFSRISDALHNKSEEIFTEELIKEMNEIYKDFVEDNLF